MCLVDFKLEEPNKNWHNTLEEQHNELLILISTVFHTIHTSSFIYAACTENVSLDHFPAIFSFNSLCTVIYHHVYLLN